MVDLNGPARNRNPNTRLENFLVRQNQHLVVPIAKEFSKQCPEPLEDLLQVGLIGLLKAIRGHDQVREFRPYANSKIRGEIRHYLRSNWGSALTCKPWIRDRYNSIIKAHQVISKDRPGATIEEVVLLSGYSLSDWDLWVSAIEASKHQMLPLAEEQ